MIKELDVVVLTEDLPTYHLKAGLEGAVVDVLGNGQAYTVEFFSAQGKTLDVVAVTPGQIRPFVGCGNVSRPSLTVKNR